MSEVSEARTGADLVADCLVAEGVTHVFGLPGTTVMDLIDAVAQNPHLRYLSTRHEQVAGFMADGFSRAGDTLGVCLASRGPGAANLSIAVQNAHDESIPMLALIGQVPGSITERRAFEEMNVVAAFRPLCKWVVEIHQVDRIPELLQRAVRTAVSGRPGPVVVSLPLDVLQAVVTAVPGPRTRIHAPAPAPAGVAEAARLLADAERPAIIVGGGAHDPEAVLRLAEAIGAPVVTTWLRKGAIPHSDPAFLGALGYGAHEVSDRLVREADVLVALGCRFSEFTTKRWTLIPESAALVHVDIDPEELGRVYPPTVGIVSDAADAATALAAALDGVDPDRDGRRRARRTALRKEFDEVRVPVEGAPQTSVVSSGALTAAVQRLADREGVVLVQDVHTFGPWIARHVSLDRPRSYYGSAGGAMAWGFPAAMGMALARPDDRVVAISGDGSFWMVAQDLETCVREDIPVINVIVNNYAYGNTRDRQRTAHGGRYHGVFLDNPDFAEYARLTGALGIRVTSDAEIPAAFEKALAHPGPVLIDVVQDRMEGLPPGLVPPAAK
ncbi:thiamine pyrophosphate-binding protein [Pseudonocardia benzenivorans]|uniref:Thiamine pyrophosphate-binding protein n=1 Tax=Pseudonocardia benzenivorans TaxID=228005 RepID=A0ABW3VT75_9PSEU|nr:MAG: thiamine pyrophosphate-binding protein [Pseudonocardiaceae bacterium]